MAEPYVGEIRMFSGNFAPRGWALCDGSLLPISQYTALYALIDTTYGGDGRTNFALPDLRGRLAVHKGTNPQTGTNFSLGQSAGTEQVTLTVNQLPVHTHTALAQAPTAGTAQSPAGAVWAESALGPYGAGPGTQAMNAAAVSAAGGGQPHENRMPYLTTTFIIALVGIFPTQS